MNEPKDPYRPIKVKLSLWQYIVDTGEKATRVLGLPKTPPNTRVIEDAIVHYNKYLDRQGRK